MKVSEAQAAALLAWEERALRRQDEIVEGMLLACPDQRPIEQRAWLESRLLEETPQVLLMLAMEGILTREDTGGPRWPVPPASRG